MNIHPPSFRRSGTGYAGMAPNDAPAGWQWLQFSDVKQGAAFKTHASAAVLVKDCNGYRSGFGRLVTLDQGLSVLVAA